MRRPKQKKPIIYVCSAVVNGKLLSNPIVALSMSEASSTFQAKNGIEPESIHGTYFAKRKGTIDKTKNIRFSGGSVKAIYDGWLVNALFLSEPKNAALLFFDKREDGKPMTKPTGTFIVNRDTLEKPNEESRHQQDQDRPPPRKRDDTREAAAEGQGIDIEGDETDRIQATIISRTHQQLSSRDAEKMVQIDKALRKIQERSFGKCVECGESIADKRLQANPYCTTCISCAEQKEMDSKQRRSQ